MPGDVDLRLAERLDDPEQRDQRRVLLQADEVVEKRRDHAPHGLREDDVPQRREPGEAERPRGGLLARVHRVDPGPVHLGDVRRVHEDQRHGAPEERRDGNARQLERGDAEAEDVDEQDRRDPAEEVRVDRREGAEREEHGPGQPAQQRDARARTRG